MFDRLGDIRPVGLGEEGLYHEGTRFLSRLTLRLFERPPLLLSSTVRTDNLLLMVDLTNADAPLGDGTLLGRDTIHVFRNCFLQDGTLYLRLVVHNYGTQSVRCALDLAFDADYADIFEVRGTTRPRRGERLPTAVRRDAVEMAYRGLDDGVRRTRVDLSPAPLELGADRARFALDLAPHAEQTIDVTVQCIVGEAAPRPAYDAALATAGEAVRLARGGDAIVRTSNERFDAWLERSVGDLHLMVTRTPEGPYPYAGIPWFSTAFGRDGIITALEYLWINPEMARGALRFLAATQATDVVPEQDAEPGKILHEMRRGEMAALGEVPFGRYYGTADATPLFVVLAGEYWRRTGDVQFLRGLWPHIEAALRWIDEWGDADGDGFVEYARRSQRGLVTQGWKDSYDSVFHADGTLAQGPIALCEVQAYVFAAQLAASALAQALGERTRAAALHAQAEALRQRFEEAFWIEDLSTYALALDGDKRPCRVRASNAGHCLFAGIASPARAKRVARTLLDPTSFSGWGVRTVATTEARYNPMAYHNGSVWPHDNALIAAGLSRYGLREGAVDVLEGLFAASRHVDQQRMPELFCGFERRPCEGPTLYPVACAPQAWAAGALFMALGACLGLDIDAPAGRLRLDRPALPASLDRLTITNLRVGDAVVDLALERHAHDVGVTLLRRTGDVELVIVK